MLKRTLTIYLIVVLSLLQAACGGGGGSNGASQDTRIASIKITPGSVMLTQVGEQRALQAQAYNAAGEEVDATFSWSSSHPDQVAIDANGMLTAQTLGSAEIKATANGVTSEPALVLLTLPVANARLVADEQIVGDFTPVDSAAPYGLGFQYTVTLRGVDAPQVGEVLLGTGEAPLGGRVVAVKQVGQDVTVTLEIIPLSEMFDKLALDEIIDLNTAPISIPQEVAEYYNVEIRPDGSLQFTLKPDAPAIDQTQSKASPGAQVAAKVTRRIGPFDCEFETGPFFSLNALSPTITIERDLSLPLVYDPNTEELRKISLKGRVKTEFKVTNTLTAQFESKGTCKREMYRISIPLNGPLALFFGGQIPVGFGFEIGGKATFAGTGFTLSAVSEFTAEVGMSCPASSPCEMIQTGEVTGQTTADWTLPNGFNPDAQLRFEPALYGFAFATLSLGPSSQVGRIARFLIDRLTIDAFELTAGVTLGANLAPVVGQILDPAYASDYKLTQDIKAGPSQTIDRILGMIGVNLVKAEYTSSLILTTSPMALAAGVTADVSTFSPGDMVNFKVRLDPTTVNFGIYNVDEVRIYRKVNTGGVINEVLVATVLASDGQTEFDLSWVATEAGAIGGDFFAFVTTRLLPIESFGALELGQVSVSGTSKLLFQRKTGSPSLYQNELYAINADGSGSEINLSQGPVYYDELTWSADGKRIAFVTERDGNREIYIVNTDGAGSPVNLSNDPGDDRLPTFSPDGSRIAFTSTRGDGVPRIYVMNIDGSGVTLVGSQEVTRHLFGTADTYEWSPDSTRLLWLCNSHTVAVDWQPVDWQVTALCIYAADGSGLQIQIPVADDVLLEPQWIDNNRILATGHSLPFEFQQPPSGAVRLAKTVSIYAINADGSGVTTLASGSALGQGDAAHPFDITLSPDGRTVAYYGGVSWGLLAQNTNGGAPVSLFRKQTFIPPLNGLIWSSDSARLLAMGFEVNSNNAEKLYVADLTTNQVVSLGDWLRTSYNISLLSGGVNAMWSPDGTQLAIQDYGVDGALIVNADSTGIPVQQTTTDPADRLLGWLP